MSAKREDEQRGYITMRCAACPYYEYTMGDDASASGCYTEQEAAVCG